jgi:hypothetical protein
MPDITRFVAGKRKGCRKSAKKAFFLKRLFLGGIIIR